MSDQAIECGAPYFLPMSVAFTGAAAEVISGVTNGNNNIDLDIVYGLTDLRQAQVQFLLQGGHIPTLWSNERIPVLSLLGSSDGLQQPGDYWTKPFYFRHDRVIEGDFLNVGGEGAGTVVFICDQPNDVISTTLNVDLPTVGEMLVLGIDPKFTNVASEIMPINYSPKKSWDFLVQGFYSDLERANLKITDCENRRWMADWTPNWALAGRGSTPLNVRKLKRPYLIPAQRSIGVEFQNDAIPEAGGKLWLYGQRLNFVRGVANR